LESGFALHWTDGSAALILKIGKKAAWEDSPTSELIETFLARANLIVSDLPRRTRFSVMV
jgi:hypothetical protein